jgi:hypothetical protein
MSATQKSKTKRTDYKRMRVVDNQRKHEINSDHDSFEDNYILEKSVYSSKTKKNGRWTDEEVFF